MIMITTVATALTREKTAIRNINHALQTSSLAKTSNVSETSTDAMGKMIVAIFRMKSIAVS